MNTQVMLGKVIGIDVTRRRVKLTDRELSAVRPRVLPAFPAALSCLGARLITAGPTG
jgi:hypothetical protein